MLLTLLLTPNERMFMEIILYVVLALLIWPWIKWFLTSFCSIKFPQSQYLFDVIIASDSVDVEEIFNLNIQYCDEEPTPGDLVPATEMALTPSGDLIAEAGRYFDDEPVNKTVFTLPLVNLATTLLFVEDSVYEKCSNKLGKKLHTFEAPKIENVTFACNVNENNLIIVGYPNDLYRHDRRIWQVNPKTYETNELDKDVYYYNSRPPKVITPDGLKGVVVIYYTGVISFGILSSYSRPKMSTVRVFTDQHPQGKNLASFHYRAGTIVDAEMIDGDLRLTGDPSHPIPTNRNHIKPARYWQVSGY